MRVTEPFTYQADPLGDGTSLLAYVDHMGDDVSITRAARVSFARDRQPPNAPKDSKLIARLLRDAHWSPFQSCYLTVHVALPMPLARQWQRHWSQAFVDLDDACDLALNEVSRRYTSEAIELFTPPFWRVQSMDNKQASGGLLDDQVTPRVEYLQAVDSALDTYDRLLGLGVAREQARFVLPQALYTRMYATASLRSWLHFLSLRQAPDAQVEIRRYADALRDLLATLWPQTLAAWNEVRPCA